MDRFSAHLDRGWDLVQQGDSTGAEASARRALELNETAPEAYNLLGYVAALRGDFDEALQHYQQALSLDETYFEALLNAAEVCIHPLSEYDEALDLCDRAIAIAETDDELVDALLLKFDALLGENRMDEARVLCTRFPEGPFENPNHVFLVGRALYEVGEIERATPLIKQAVRATPDNSEAYYYLGLLEDEEGDRARATEAFIKARSLDVLIPPPDWSLSPETFEHMTRKVVSTLPEHLRRVVRLDEIYVTDMPGVEFVVDGVDPRALILMDDIAPDPMPSARLFVYQRNLERLAGALEAVEGELEAALERELTALLEEHDLAQVGTVDKKLLN